MLNEIRNSEPKFKNENDSMEAKKKKKNKNENDTKNKMHVNSKDLTYTWHIYLINQILII